MLASSQMTGFTGYITIIPRCKVFGRERSISGLRAGALPRLVSETRLRAQDRSEA